MPNDLIGKHGGAPDTARTLRSYLATMGKVLCCHLDLSSRTGHLCGCSYLGLQKESCIVLLIVLYLGRRGVYTIFVAKAFALFRAHFGRGYKPGRSGCTVRAVQALPPASGELTVVPRLFIMFAFVSETVELFLSPAGRLQDGERRGRFGLFSLANCEVHGRWATTSEVRRVLSGRGPV